MENNAWRWTGRAFAAVLENPAGASRFEMRFRTTPELMRAAADRETPLHVEVEIDGVPLGSETYLAPGDHVYSRALPHRATRHAVQVRLSRTFEAGGRDLGVIIMLPPGTIVDEDTGLRLLA